MLASYLGIDFLYMYGDIVRLLGWAMFKKKCIHFVFVNDGNVTIIQNIKLKPVRI